MHCPVPTCLAKSIALLHILSLQRPRSHHLTVLVCTTAFRDNDWAWNPLYDQLSVCGEPLSDPVGNPEETVYTRAYEGCSVRLDCTNTTTDGCIASLDVARIART